MVSRTNLDDYARRARRRLILAAIVGAVFFASGVGIVAALAPEDAGTDAVADEPAVESAATLRPTDSMVPAGPVQEAADAGQPKEPTPAAVPSPEPDAAEPAPRAPGASWWTDLAGKRCKVMYGDHDRLVVREGTLRRDETTTYGPFVDNNVVARVRRENATEVTVLHLGIHPRNGRPSLAHVTVHEASGDIEGILPLQIGGDQIELRPVDGGRR